MLQRRWFAAGLIAAVFAAPVHAQEVSLEWKFKAKDKFYQEMTTKTTQTMKIMGQDIKQDQEQTFLFSWDVTDATEMKTVIVQKIEAVKMKITIGNNPIVYDSTLKDAADNPLSTFFKPLVGASFTLSLNPDLQVTEIKGREEFVKKLKEANPQMATLLERILSEEQLKQMSEPAFAVVPGKSQKVKAGDTWVRPKSGSLKLNMGPIGTYDAKYSYKYIGTDKKGDVTLHKIEMTTELTYKAPEGNEAAGLPFKIESGSLKATEAKGLIYFDADKGRVVETNMSVKLEGDLKIAVGDQKADVNLKQDQSTKTTTSDKNPYEK